MSNNACFFAGRRWISSKRIGVVVQRLSRAIDILAANGVTDFISFGKKGFDILAATLVLVKRESGAPIRLIMIRPCVDFLRSSSAPGRQLISKISNEADKVVYTTERVSEYVFNCAQTCLCYMPRKIDLLKNWSLLKNRFIINVAYTV
ncbi:MAG: hypothetical protein ACOX1Q_04525 [Eubacteriales bacterium]|jgi:hypothetical protein